MKMFVVVRIVFDIESGTDFAPEIYGPFDSALFAVKWLATDPFSTSIRAQTIVCEVTFPW